MSPFFGARQIAEAKSGAELVEAAWSLGLLAAQSGIEVANGGELVFAEAGDEGREFAAAGVGPTALIDQPRRPGS